MDLYNNYTVNWYKNRDDYTKAKNQAYRDRHPEFPRLEFPKHFYFRYIPDRRIVHWAIIVPEGNYYSVYFINVLGQAFDKLVFKTKKQAQRGLRRNDFYFSTNKRPPCEPIQPIFVDFCKGKKTATYSKGVLWDKTRERLAKKSKKTQPYVPPELYKPAIFNKIPKIIQFVLILPFLILFWIQQAPEKVISFILLLLILYLMHLFLG